jgi:succinate-acetate transporter protein
MYVSTPTDSPATPAVADPAPLGLAAFALTTFLLSVVNAHWATSSSGFAWLGYALAYGGLVQLLAGMWEFKNKNVFGATAFSTYGGFWIGLFFYVHTVVVGGLVHSGLQVHRDLGWILLAFAIFNTYMLIISTQLTTAVFAVFLTLELTEIILFIGNFTINASQVANGDTNAVLKIGGIVGIITALTAWYASAAGVLNGLKGKVVAPVGGPLMSIGG